MKIMRHRARCRGTTLVELVISIVIVSVATIGLRLVVSVTTARSADPMVESLAQAIAASYLEEIAQPAFCDPGFNLDGNPATTCRTECIASAGASGCGGIRFSSGGGRAKFNDVCDYEGLNDTGARDRNGAAVPGLNAYKVVVAVNDRGLSLGAPALNSNAGQIVRVDVIVTHAALAQPVSLAVYKANAQWTREAPVPASHGSS